MTALSTSRTAVRPARRRRPPWYLWVPAVAVAFGVMVPLIYLMLRAFAGEADQTQTFAQVWEDVGTPLINTLALVGGVLVVVTLVSLPIGWLTTWTNLPGRTFFSLTCVMPLAIPGYVMAYALLGLGGYYGMLSRLLGETVQQPRGYWGALCALSSYNLPYMYLNVRAALLGLDPSLEEAARSLGHGRTRILFGVVLPQLKPAIMTGAMLVALHVIADFGVVSLMGYDALSWVLYRKFRMLSDSGSAARIGLLMLLITMAFAAAEIWLLRGLRLARAGTGNRRRRKPARLRWHVLWALPTMVTLVLVTVVLPTAVIGYWLWRVDLGEIMPDLWQAVGHSVKASLPAALLAGALAFPIALLRARYPSWFSQVAERLPYFGYATPALVFALSVVFLSTQSMHWAEALNNALPGMELAFVERVAQALYQSFPLLVMAYVLHFLAEAIGPVRSSLYTAPRGLEEASRSLGVGRFASFMKVTLPIARHGLIVSTALVFLSCMKELPLTMLLAPTGFRTLAIDVWDHSENAEFGRAAPYALTILVVSSAFVGVLLMQGRERK